METRTRQPVSLSVFIPFYNEESNIRSVVKDVVGVMSTHPRISHYEVIMINDGSRDRTPHIARELEQEFPMSRLVSHEVNRGYGGAVQSGIRQSKYDYIFYMDGDNQFNIREIDKLLVHIPEHEAVIGYRHDRQDKAHRKLNALLWNRLVRLVFGLKVRDIDCAFKLLKRERVIEHVYISEGAVISTELLLKLQKGGVVFKEVPINHYPRTEGKPTGAGLKVIGKAFKELYGLYKIV